MNRVLIICPFYEDDNSLNIFLNELGKEADTLTNSKLCVLIVNDGSSHIQATTGIPVTIIHLQRNLGHQKAIAIGISYASENIEFDKVIVMDCDGEDQPKDLHKILNHYNPSKKIIVAKRSKRTEKGWFRFFYRVYKFLFFLLTGKKINFGNFMLMEATQASAVTHYSEIWSHLAGTIIKSKLPYTCVEIERGTRYADKSKMNFTGLLMHGLGAIGVFVEIIAARLLLFSLLIIACSIITILLIFLIRFFTDLAIPGWATTAVSSMLIVLLQSFLLSLFTIFLYISSQGQRKFIPALHYMDYVQKVDHYQNA